MTIVHVSRRTRGIAGASARQGALYGWAWPIAFVAQSMIVGGLGQAGASDEVTALAANAIAALVVGLLYIAGGLLWDATAMYVLGAWMALVGAAAALTGLPGVLPGHGARRRRRAARARPRRRGSASRG